MASGKSAKRRVAKKGGRKKAVRKGDDAASSCMDTGTKYVPEQEIGIGSTRCSLMAHPNFVQECPREVVVIPAHFTTTPKKGFRVSATTTRVQPKKYRIRCVVTIQNNLVTGECRRMGNGSNSGPTLPNYSETQC